MQLRPCAGLCWTATLPRCIYWYIPIIIPQKVLHHCWWHHSFVILIFALLLPHMWVICFCTVLRQAIAMFQTLQALPRKYPHHVWLVQLRTKRKHQTILKAVPMRWLVIPMCSQNHLQSSHNLPIFQSWLKPTTEAASYRPPRCFPPSQRTNLMHTDLKGPKIWLGRKPGARHRALLVDHAAWIGRMVSLIFQNFQRSHSLIEVLCLNQLRFLQGMWLPHIHLKWHELTIHRQLNTIWSDDSGGSRH